MDDLAAAQALVEVAEVIHAAVREHKRSQEEHRRQARRLMRALDLIRGECERLGIDLKITQAPRRESK